MIFSPDREKEPQTKQAAEGLIRIGQHSLIRLRHQASRISLGQNKIRAQQAGHYLSSFRGRGMEFAESRAYQAGDDIRNMDWKVTARTGAAHTKIFSEERERPVLCWSDFREPMHFATHGVFKSVIAAKTAAAIGWAACEHGDRLGGLVFSERTHHELKPQRGKTAVLQLINQLDRIQQHHNPSEVSAINAEQALARLRRVARPGSLIFLISDFRQLGEKARSHITQLSRHNDIVMFFIYDLLEAQLPQAGNYLVQHQQTKFMFSCNSDSRQQYQQHFLQRRDELQDFARKHGISFLQCRTDQDPVARLINAFN